MEALAVDAGDLLTLRVVKPKPGFGRQGLWLATRGRLRIDDDPAPQFLLWADRVPDEVVIRVDHTDGLVRFCNVFDSIASQLYGGGMLRQDASDGWIEYVCNNMGLEDTYEKLVFRVRIPAGPERR